VEHKKVRITAGSTVVEAELNDTATAGSISAALPLKGRVNTWGNEIYFSVPLQLESENGKEVVNMGDIGYWPDGPALCLFFGPTPMSRGSEIRAASQVNIVGKIVGDTAVLKRVRAGSNIVIERLD
jgi:hypothetical protein